MVRATSSWTAKTSFELPIVALGPAVGASRGIDELGGDADAIASAANAAFEHVADAELATDLSDVGGLALVLEARIAGDDEQLGEARELGDDVFGDAVAEVFLAWVAAHVGEGKDGDRGLVGQCQRRLLLGGGELSVGAESIR